MADRPILMSAPMVRAILTGTKTQTRRVLKQATGPSLSVGMSDDDAGVAELSWLWGDGPGYDVNETIKRVACPYGQPGDRLWVRETWGYFDPDCSGYEEEIEDRGKGPGLHCAPEMMQEGHPLRDFWRRRVAYAATWEEPKFGNGPDKPSRWRPSIHMPRWASRITLEVTGVRVERLQDISEKDAWTEGCEGYDDDVTGGKSGYSEFHDLWEQINGPESWAANPWVWCVSFRRLEAAC